MDRRLALSVFNHTLLGVFRDHKRPLHWHHHHHCQQTLTSCSALACVICPVLTKRGPLAAVVPTLPTALKSSSFVFVLLSGNLLTDHYQDHHGSCQESVSQVVGQKTQDLRIVAHGIVAPFAYEGQPASDATR